MPETFYAVIRTADNVIEAEPEVLLKVSGKWVTDRAFHTRDGQEYLGKLMARDEEHAVLQWRTFGTILNRNTRAQA